MFDIKNFNEYREDNKLEVKKAKGGLPISLWETYSSFANTNGGVIILGATENQDGSLKLTGLEDSTKLRKDFWNTIHNRQKVSMNLLKEEDVQVYDEPEGVIMVIYVPRAMRENKPVYINDDMFQGSYRRNWEGDYKCTYDEVKAMLRDQPEMTNDMKVLDDILLEELDYETIHGYRNRHMVFKPGHPWEKYNDEKYLIMIGAAAIAKSDGKLHPTAAGLLMFGHDYLITREFPEYFLDYRELLDPSIRWTDRFISSSGEWSGNIFDFYFRVYNKLIKDLKVPFKMENGIRIDDTPVHKALREALANCLINADYYGRCGIVIRKEPDSIIIENPGYIRLGKKQMMVGGQSDPRNKNLMKMFNMINIGERAGSGVPDIFATWNYEGWKIPIIEEKFNPDRTILTLSFEKEQAIKASDKKQAIKTSDKKKMLKSDNHKKIIIQYLKEYKSGKTNDIADYIGLSSVRTRKLMSELVEEDIIITNGNNKNRFYVLK